MTHPKIDVELERLLPKAEAFKASESDKPAGSLPSHETHDGNAVADANLEAFVKAHGVGTIVVSTGPWKQGVIVDGCRRFRIAERLKLKAGVDYRVDERAFADKTAAKRFRWEANISSKRTVPYYMVVRSFLSDQELTAYFNGLAAEGKRRMSEGGRKGGKSAGKAVEGEGFDRRLVAAHYCGVAPWQMFYAQKVYRWETNCDQFFDSKHAPEVFKWVRKAYTGDKDAKSVYMHLKQLQRRGKREERIEAGSKLTNDKASELPKVYDGQKNVVLHGDCLEVMKDVPNESVDRVVTSPPYFVAKLKYGSDWKGFKTWEDYVSFTRKYLDECWRLLKPWGVLAINVDNTTEDHELAKQFGRLRQTYDHSGLIRSYLAERYGCMTVQEKVWTKKNIAGKASARGSLGNPNNRPNHEWVLFFWKGKRELQSMTPTIDERELSDWSMSTWDICPEVSKAHVAPFPRELAKRMVCYGGSLDDVVLDPFSGTGTTLEVAASEGRSYIGIEALSAYAEMSVESGARGLSEWERRMREAQGQLR